MSDLVTYFAFALNVVVLVPFVAFATIVFFPWVDGVQ